MNQSQMNQMIKTLGINSSDNNFFNNFALCSNKLQ